LIFRLVGSRNLANLGKSSSGLGRFYIDFPMEKASKLL
jgi:hypothetical protein